MRTIDDKCSLNDSILPNTTICLFPSLFIIVKQSAKLLLKVEGNKDNESIKYEMRPFDEF